MKTKILIAATRSITINVFLDKFIDSCYKKNINLSFICSDIKNINYELLNSNLNNLLFSLNLPKNAYEFLNVFRIFYILLKLRYFFKRNKFDIIFLHTPLISHLIRLATIGLNLNICYFVHGYRFHTKVKLFYRIIFFSIEYFLSINTKKYIVINSEDMKYTKKYFSKDFLYLKGIGIDLIKKKIPSKNITNSFQIGVIAGYKKIKGYDDIIYVANKLKKNENIFFNTFGYENNNKYKKIIKKLNLKNIKINSFVKEIYKEIDNFDILLHLSKREGLSTVTIQSLHRGVPVIGYNIRGIRDVITNTFNGILINFADREKVVKVINFIYENKHLYYSMQKRASISIDQTFSKDHSTKIILKYLGL